MMIKRSVCLAFTAACLTGIATLPAAHAQAVYGTLPTGDPGGNSMGLPGPNPGGPGLTPYTGGATGATRPYPGYAAPTATGTGNTEVVTNSPQAYPARPPGWSPEKNVLQSERYTRLLEHNRAFRQARERAGSAARSPTRNCTRTASRALPNTRPGLDLRPPMAHELKP
jgi:hypothetical protein